MKGVDLNVEVVKKIDREFLLSGVIVYNLCSYNFLNLISGFVFIFSHS